MFKKTSAVVLALLAFNAFFYNNHVPNFGTMGFFILMVVTHIFLWISFYKSEFKKKDKLALVSTGISLVATFLSVIRASDVDRGLLSLLAITLSFSTFYLLSLSHNVFGAASEVFAIPWKLFTGWLKSSKKIIPKSLGFIRKVSSLTIKIFPKKKIVNGNLGTLLRGAFITFPVVGLIVLLLGDADPIFMKTVEDLFSFEIKLPEFIISIPDRVVQSLFLLGLIVPMALLKIESKFVSPLKNKVYGKYRGEMIMLVGSLAVVLGLFLVIQFKYLFATVEETQLHQFGVQTYSEYVRKGFFEMTLVSVISYLVSVTSLLVYRANKKKKDWLKMLNIALLFEVMVFIGSVFRRVVLYQAEHGLTRIRVYGMMFLLLMIGLTVILWLRQVRQSFNNWYLYEVGVVIAVVLITSTMNVDNLVATVFQPTVNEEVDFTYISRLSTDGLEGWKQSWIHVKEVIAMVDRTEVMTKENQAREVYYAYSAVDSFRQNYYILLMQYGTPEDHKEAGITVIRTEPVWYQMNLSEWMSYKKLKDVVSYQEVDKAKDHLYWIYKSSPELQKNIRYDRSSRTPLL